MPAYKLVIPLLLWLASPAYSQDAALHRKVRTGQKVMKIEDLGKAINQQSKLVLSYNARDIRPGQALQLGQNEYSVLQLLELIRRQTNVNYRVIGDHVVLTKSPAVGDGSSPGDVAIANIKKQENGGSAFIQNSKADMRRSVQPAVGITDAAKMHNDKSGTKETTYSHRAHDSVSIQSDGPAKSGHTAGNSTSRSLFPGQLQPIPILAKAGKRVAATLPPLRQPVPVHPIALRSPAPARTGWSPEWHVTSGLSADLAFILNPLIRGGINEAYGILGWRSNFKTSGPQFGLGTCIILEERWNMRIELTTGPLKKVAALDSGTIRTGNVELRGWLHSGAVLVDRKIGQHFRLMAGPSFNIMNTSYYYGGVKTAPDDIPGTGRDNDAAFSFFKAPLQLSNDFSRTNSSHRTLWLNFHLGIFYRL
ncbi:hypothetical protein ACWKWU_14250 [Chitinophaga lutea]